MSPTTIHRLAQDFVALFVTVDPISLVPLFITATAGYSVASRRSIARRAVLIAAVILIGFILVGQTLLEALGIGLASFRIAGGLVLLVIGLRMVLAEATPIVTTVPEGEEAGLLARDLAVFPIASPYIAGPGAIMAVVLLTDNSRFGVSEQALTTAVMLVVLLICYLAMIAATTVQRMLGDTGAMVISRIMGLVLAALAVETIVAGVVIVMHIT